MFKKTMGEAAGGTLVEADLKPVEEEIEIKKTGAKPFKCPRCQKEFWVYPKAGWKGGGLVAVKHCDEQFILGGAVPA